MLWLSLNFYQLPLDVFLLEQAQTTELSVIENGVLSYCNQASFSKGLEPGMKVSTAYALSDQVKVKNRAYELEKNTLIQLATVAYEFSSQVCIYSDQAILLEVEASCRLFTDLSSLLKKLTLRLNDFSIRSFVAFSATAKSAYLLSCYQQISLKEQLQSIEQKSATSISEESEKQLLQVPIGLLNSDPTIDLSLKLKKMQQMGIKNVKELSRFPVSSIGRRFGKDFLNYLYRLKGDIADPMALFNLPEKFSIQRCFIDGLDSVEQILFPARPMVEQLGYFLKARRVMAVKITWHFICFNGDELFFDIELSSEVQSSEQLMALTRLKLQSFILQEKVETIFLQSENFISLKEKQKDLLLFDCSTLPSNGDVESLMDKLKVRLGDNKCSKPYFKDEYLPEYNSLVCSVTKGKLSDNYLTSLLNSQPLWLMDEPEQIYTFEVKNNKQLNYKGRLAISSKAERIESQWWDDGQRRDYYIAENLTGVRYWIYFDLNKNDWLAHGIF